MGANRATERFRRIFSLRTALSTLVASTVACPAGSATAASPAGTDPRDTPAYDKLLCPMKWAASSHPMLAHSELLLHA